jgi:3-isopropylmalate dehydrogenase
MAIPVKNILMLAGDGIGPEVMQSVTTIIDYINKFGDVQINVAHHLIGGASYDTHGTPLTDEVITACKKSDAILLGAVGGTKWAQVDYDKRPEAGLLKLRKELNLFANLRPAIVFDSLISASSLKPEYIKGLDIMIVRELTGGVYFGEPRGIFDEPNGERRGINTQVYTTSEIIRVGRVAFETARLRRKKLCSVEKSNVMESGILWREEITKLAAEYPDVELSHMYADNCAMQLLRTPSQFDVIVTDNLFGDILSDEASMLTGSLGMLPSASLSHKGMPSLYEPIHGSAPDIAGQNIANPMAALLSFAMACDMALNLPTWGTRIFGAIDAVLKKNIRTKDIALPDSHVLGTRDITIEILNEMDQQK